MSIGLNRSPVCTTFIRYHVVTPLAIDIQTRAAGIRHPRIEWRARSEPCTAMVTHFHVFLILKILRFYPYTLPVYSTPLLYPSKKLGVDTLPDRQAFPRVSFRPVASV